MVRDSNRRDWNEPGDNSIDIDFDVDIDSTAPRTGIPTDAAFEVLGHTHRRVLLEILAGRSPPQRTGVLARELTAQIGGWKGSPEVRDAQLAVHHIHLPKLDDADLIRYDAESRTVVAVDRDRIRRVFDATDIDRPEMDPSTRGR
jgi:hypothetical protein